MEADKVTEKKVSKLPAFIHCIALGAGSGMMIGVAFNSPWIGGGVSLGLFAIVTAIFLSQDNL